MSHMYVAELANNEQFLYVAVVASVAVGLLVCRSLAQEHAKEVCMLYRGEY